jgi:hypothetical protein
MKNGLIKVLSMSKPVPLFVTLFVSSMCALFFVACRKDFLDNTNKVAPTSTTYKQQGVFNAQEIDNAKQWFDLQKQTKKHGNIDSAKVVPLWKYALVYGNKIEVPVTIDGKWVTHSMVANDTNYKGKQRMVIYKKSDNKYDAYIVDFVPSKDFRNIKSVNIGNYGRQKFDGRVLISDLGNQMIGSYEFKQGVRGKFATAQKKQNNALQSRNCVFIPMYVCRYTGGHVEMEWDWEYMMWIPVVKTERCDFEDVEVCDDGGGGGGGDDCASMNPPPWCNLYPCSGPFPPSYCDPCNSPTPPLYCFGGDDTGGGCTSPNPCDCNPNAPGCPPQPCTPCTKSTSRDNAWYEFFGGEVMGVSVGVAQVNMELETWGVSCATQSGGQNKLNPKLEWWWWGTFKNERETKDITRRDRINPSDPKCGSKFLTSCSGYLEYTAATGPWMGIPFPASWSMGVFSTFN